ncbi:hypothetical protein Vadar_004013 [Vaccinium darrowii]|uniref:Uncharacterized protein n=1 Tax=Vaccinium darrowii TaxID=229202 RepID=A0ACB7XWP3_9ERIC|nr:hypothetical protein Vadar_004013 [Vaccinium darrowii]
MEDEISEKLSAFVLTKEEDEVALLSEDDVKLSRKECERSLMGKIFTYKNIHLGGLKAAMEIAWGFPQGFRVLEVGMGIYQFVFGKEADLIRVLASCPWLYNNHLIVLQRWSAGVKPSRIYFSDSPFWIQLRGLPLEYMSVEVGRKMMIGFGDVQEVEVAQLSGKQGRCVQVKVELDITKALPRGKKAMMLNWEPFWVSFRYEKLPIFCHYCGVVGHDDKVCMEKYNDSKGGQVKENQYGAWLKASPVKAPPHRPSEDKSDFSPEMSSSEKAGKGRSENQGEDIRNPGDLGVLKNGSERVQRDSHQSKDWSLEESGAELLMSGSSQPSRVGSPNNKPNFKISESLGVLEEKDQNESGKHGPVDNMEEDQIFLETQNTEAISLSQNEENKLALNEGGAGGGRFSTHVQLKIGEKPSDKSLQKGQKLSGKQIAKQLLVLGGEAAKPVKRKLDASLADAVGDEDDNNGTAKKQKLVSNVGEIFVAETVEEASRKWPQVAR